MGQVQVKLLVKRLWPALSRSAGLRSGVLAGNHPLDLCRLGNRRSDPLRGVAYDLFNPLTTVLTLRLDQREFLARPNRTSETILEAKL